MLNTIPKDIPFVIHHSPLEPHANHVHPLMYINSTWKLPNIFLGLFRVADFIKLPTGNFHSPPQHPPSEVYQLGIEIACQLLGPPGFAENSLRCDNTPGRFSRLVSPERNEKKTSYILSIESWLVNRDPYNGL